MRKNVYLLAAAIVAVAVTPVLSSEVTIGDSTFITYDENYVTAAPDAAFGDTYVAGDIVYIDEATMEQAEYSVPIYDQFGYSAESVEQVYAIDGIDMAQDVPSMTETIDGIVYETVAAPAQTY